MGVRGKSTSLSIVVLLNNKDRNGKQKIIYIDGQIDRQKDSKNIPMKILFLA